jgi:hypothetical protein
MPLRRAALTKVLACLALCAMLSTTGVVGFVEEECFVGGQVDNLYSTAVGLNCSYGEFTMR